MSCVIIYPHTRHQGIYLPSWMMVPSAPWTTPYPDALSLSHWLSYTLPSAKRKMPYPDLRPFSHPPSYTWPLEYIYNGIFHILRGVLPRRQSHWHNGISWPDLLPARYSPSYMLPLAQRSTPRPRGRSSRKYSS